MGEFTVDTVMVDTVARDLLMLNLMPKLGEPLDTDTVPDMVLVDMEVTVLALPAMGVTVLDTVSGRDPLMPMLGVPLDTDTVLDMVLVDMEVTVLALPATEVTDLDTVSGRDPLMLMPGTEVATEDTDTVDIDMESNFYISNNELPCILISSHHSYQNQILFRHVSSKVEEEFLK